MTYDGARVRAGELRRGFDQAVARFELAMSQKPDTTFFALFEALNWAVALDDVIAEIWRPAGAREGYGWRERVEGASVLDGIRFVRNRVHHHWADALELRRDQQDLWVWQQATELPVGRLDDSGNRAYSEHLEGQPVRTTFEQLSLTFERVLLFLEPPRPKMRL